MAAIVSFSTMAEAELRQWVTENPGDVNATDRDSWTPLFVTSWSLTHLALTIWLVDEMGADVNGQISNNTTPLHVVGDAAILNALLDRGADPTPSNRTGILPLMIHAGDGKSDCIQ